MFTTIQQHRRRRYIFQWLSVGFFWVMMDSAWHEGTFSRFITERWHQGAHLEALTLLDDIPEWKKKKKVDGGVQAWALSACCGRKQESLECSSSLYLLISSRWNRMMPPTVGWTNRDASASTLGCLCSSEPQEHLSHLTRIATSSHLVNFGGWHL